MHKEQMAKKGTQKARHTFQRKRNPVCKVVDKAVVQKTRQYRQKDILKAMEPIKQINLKSYIGLAFKQLGRSSKPIRKTKSSQGVNLNFLSDSSSSASGTSLSTSENSDKTSTSQSGNDSNSPSSGLSDPSSTDSSSSLSGHDSDSSEFVGRSHRHHRN